MIRERVKFIGPMTSGHFPSGDVSPPGFRIPREKHAEVGRDVLIGTLNSALDDEGTDNAPLDFVEAIEGFLIALAHFSYATNRTWTETVERCSHGVRLDRKCLACQAEAGAAFSDERKAERPMMRLEGDVTSATSPMLGIGELLSGVPGMPDPGLPDPNDRG